MMEWSEFENKLYENPYFTINNNSKRKIVLFGNCHMATIGYFLNYLFNEQYNIHIIISWFFEKNGCENFDMIKINEQINNIVSKADIFIYQQHIKSYGVNADIIHNNVNSNTIVIKIPNLRLLFDVDTTEEYNRSLNLLLYSINNSDFKEFKFMVDNLKDVHFFNTREHPTHYTLFLLSKTVKNYVLNNYKTNIISNHQPINIDDYYSKYNRLLYKRITSYVVLPGKDEITEEISKITGIKKDGDYFD